MTLPRYFDSHAHLCSKDVFNSIDPILERAKASQVDYILNICTDVDTLQKGVTLRKKFPWVFNAAATTPHDAEKEGEAVFPIIAQHARNGDLAAIGETGLDYFYYKETQEAQKNLFRRYLQLALECKLPIVIHCRDAFDDFFKILDEEYIVNGKHAPGVLHCFTGTFDDAQKVIERGWYLSLSGIVTFKRSEELRKVAKWVPLDQLLVETDTPYLAPQSRRGKLNEPSYLPETVAMIAESKGLPVEEIAEATYQNAFKFIQKPL